MRFVYRLLQAPNVVIPAEIHGAHNRIGVVEPGVLPPRDTWQSSHLLQDGLAIFAKQSCSFTY
jgi:hypothetical protein